MLPDFEPAVITECQEFPLPINVVRLSFKQVYLNKMVQYLVQR